MKLYILMGSMVEVPKTPLLYFALSYIICVKYVGIKFDPWMISLLVMQQNQHSEFVFTHKNHIFPKLIHDATLWACISYSLQLLPLLGGGDAS